MNDKLKEVWDDKLYVSPLKQRREVLKEMKELEKDYLTYKSAGNKSEATKKFKDFHNRAIDHFDGKATGGGGRTDLAPLFDDNK